MTDPPTGQSHGDDGIKHGFEISFVPSSYGTRVVVDGHEYPALADVHDREIRLAIARHRDCSSRYLADLAAEPEAGIREAVGAHPRTPSAALDELARDPALMVRAAVAGNPATDPLTLEDLGQHNKPARQLKAAARNDSTPTETLRALARHINIEVAREASQTLRRRGIEVDTPSATYDSSVYDESGPDSHQSDSIPPAQGSPGHVLLGSIGTAALTDSRPTMKVEIGDGQTIDISRAAADLITQVYAAREDTRSKLMPLLDRIALGEDAQAIGLRAIARVFPDDFEGVSDLLIALPREPKGFPVVVPERTPGDDRSPKKIIRDDAVIAERVLRQNKKRSGNSRLVVGKGETRRRWIGLGQEFGVGPFGGGWEPGDPPAGEEIFEPFAPEEAPSAPGDPPLALSVSEADATSRPSGREPRFTIDTPPEEVRRIVISTVDRGLVRQRLAENGDQIVDMADLLLARLEAMLDARHGVGGNFPPEPIDAEPPTLDEIRKLKEELQSFRESLRAAIANPTGRTEPVIERGANLLAAIKTIDQYAITRIPTLAVAGLGIAHLVELTGFAMTTGNMLTLIGAMLGAGVAAKHSGYGKDDAK